MILLSMTVICFKKNTKIQQRSHTAFATDSECSAGDAVDSNRRESLFLQQLKNSTETLMPRQGLFVRHSPLLISYWASVASPTQGSLVPRPLYARGARPRAYKGLGAGYEGVFNLQNA